MSAFTKALVVTPLADGKSWVILSDFSYGVGTEDSDDRIVVERGFVTDFASVPQALWWAFPRCGKYGNAAVVHDWLYWVQTRSRKESDLVFLEAMIVLDVPVYKRLPMFWAARAFGWWAWLSNAMDRTGFHDRVLASFLELKANTVSGRVGVIKKLLRGFYG